ncbi:alpha-amylase family glycosyl hydrolase [Pseudoalteromonas luteoviolacea]|uniref:alpha-amylase family glycosyl hydrolase n=1 Tax=Pseudoalteromonas luteoviolacea TaxID=43657 RepID=UPI000B01F5EA|nr:alpha-amylase family glycosyl hydrolase [Pseudoalteromonas luteoviolacea]
MAHGSGTRVAGSQFGNKQYPHLTAQITSIKPVQLTLKITAITRGALQHCELVGLHDLDTDAPYVQSQLANYLNDLLDIGVAGFRLDASKHMPANDIGDIPGKLNKQSVVFQEVIDQGG